MKWCWNNDNHHRRLLRLCLESTEQWTEWFQLFFSVCYYQISILFIRRQKESDKERVEEHVEGKKTIEMCAFDVKWHNALSKPISIQRCSFFWCWKFIDSGILSWYASKNFFPLSMVHLLTQKASMITWIFQRIYIVQRTHKVQREPSFWEF